MKGLDLRKFRKVSADDDFTTLSHYAGHEIRVAHKKLSKAHRSQLDILPMAKGGKVPKNKGPYVDPEAARAVEAGAMGRQAQPSKASPTQGEGYTSTPVTRPSPDPDSAKRDSLERQKAAFNAKTAQPYAEGGGIEDIELKDPEVTDVDLDEPSILAEDISLPQGAPREMPPDAPGFAQTAGHVIGKSISGGISDTVSGLKRVGSAITDNPITRGISSGVQGVVQGASGQPLAPIPTMDQAPPAQPSAPAEEARAPAAAPAEAAPQQSPQAAPSQGSSLLSDFDKQTKAQAKILEDSVKEQNAIITEAHKNYQASKDDFAHFMHDVQTQQIDPDRLWNSKTDLGRAATIMGIMLAGFSPAARPNAAIEELNKAIDRDIDSQKAELGKKQTLLSMNMQHSRDLNQALEMTKTMQMGAMTEKMKAAAAKVGDPASKAKILQDITQYEATIAARVEKQAQQKALSQAMELAKKDPSKTQAVLEAVRRSDPKAGEDLAARTTPYGFANTSEGGKAVREAYAANEKTQSGVKRLLEISKTPFKSLSPALRAESETLQAEMMGPMRTVMGLGTLSEGDKKLLESMIRSPTAIFSLDSTNRKSLETLSNRMNVGVAALAKANGLNPPEAPKEPEYQTMGGVKYMKVPGGWKKAQ